MRIGIVGVSGYGGSELRRLCAQHPSFRLVYAGADSTAGQAVGELDLLFASLPTGMSRDLLARLPGSMKIVDVGGDHRFVEGWTYGLTELPGQRAGIEGASRLANSGCYPAAAVTTATSKRTRTSLPADSKRTRMSRRWSGRSN